jgi:hypothetical protein
VIRSVRRGEQRSKPCTAERLRDDSDEWHTRRHGNRVYSTTMIHQFQYPKVTPVRPGTGSGSKPTGSTGSGSSRRTA